MASPQQQTESWYEPEKHQAPPQPQYDEGLEVVHGSDVEKANYYNQQQQQHLQHSSPTQVPVHAASTWGHNTPHSTHASPRWAHTAPYDGNGGNPEWAGIPPDHNNPNNSKKWWKKKKTVILVAALLVLVGLAMGLGIGLGVGLRKKHSDGTTDSSQSDENNKDDGSDKSDDSSGASTNTDTPDEDPNSTAVCGDDLCPQILSTLVHDSTLYTFARTQAGRIAFRTYDGSSWAEWADLGEATVSIISQPTAASWNVNETIPRLDVAVVGSDGRSIYNKWYSEEEGWSPKDDWRRIGADSGSVITTCQGKPDRLDFWHNEFGKGNISHVWWVERPANKITKAGRNGDTGQIGDWRYTPDEWEENDFGTNAAVGVVCRESETYHDLLYYDKENPRVWHNSWTDDGGWVRNSFPGDFVGDPSVFFFDNDSWNFFGVQANRALYHLQWSSEVDGGYSSLMSLGGTIASMPSVVSLATGQLDVVALGIDGDLHHRHYDGTSWSATWENLDIKAHSAPAVAVLGKKVIITAISQNGTLLAWSRDSTNAMNWKSSLGPNKDLGGKLTLRYLTDES